MEAVAMERAGALVARKLRPAVALLPHAFRADTLNARSKLLSGAG